MDYESTRCARLMTKAFAAHCDLKMKNASSLGVKGEETLAEMQLLAGWVAEARERGEERDDAARRMRRIDGGQNLVDGKETTSVSVSFPTPMRTAGDKFKVLMHAAQNGVDTLRAEIVQMARSDEIDDALLLILTGTCRAFPNPDTTFYRPWSSTLLVMYVAVASTSNTYCILATLTNISQVHCLPIRATCTLGTDTFRLQRQRGERAGGGRRRASEISAENSRGVRAGMEKCERVT